MRFKQILFLALTLITLWAPAQEADKSVFADRFNFIMANDLGRNGYYDQKPIAEEMGRMADIADINFIIAAGDTHHFMGVQSVNDPLWMTNYELIYSHPSLMIPWYAICGNHEYRGNTQAVLDYSKVSRRWIIPARYYTQVWNENSTSVRLIYLDTTPLMDKYRENKTTYPDAYKQDYEKQLAWADSVLSISKEDWKIVIGHHPIYCETSKEESERADMQKRLLPILNKYKVDVYACGHIHNFQHLRFKGSDVDLIVNSSGSLSRPVKAIEGTRFCSSEAGFSVFSITPKDLQIHMMDKTGNILYTVFRKK